ncbi:DUF2884 family protein [Pleionea litopenaei]|uniref:DUF2884 family protein n=1 Tax=Pleionea litopenaei TaxID=3070815 RepID=A0AA51RR50_9GAMM|nr:DUF2884 family protein [Pleionea sp. HL-JVS1]WMS86008.1 DUF2884 family protein [Pleionea sp. HL-JVS1]
MYRNLYLLISLVSVSAFAGIQTDSCKLDLPYDININKQAVEILDHGNSLVKIDNSNQLYIKGERQILNAKQQQLTTEMAVECRAMVPIIANIASEAAEIGVKAASITINALFVDDIEFQDKMMKKLDGLSEKIKANFNESYVNGQLLNDAKLDQTFEKEIESLVSEAVEKASGKIVAKSLAQIFSGDEEELADFEFRMEMFGEDLERELEAQAADIEKEAVKFCDHLRRIDAVETKLQAELAAYKHIDLVH